MEDTVFPLPAVAEELKKNFIEARLHTDGKEDVHLDQAKMLKEMTGGIANPSYVIIDPAADPKSQSPLAVKQGWIPREDKFLAFLGGAKHAK